MSDNVSESDSFDSAVPEPQIGDRTYPFVVPQALKALTDRTKYLLNAIAPSTNPPPFTSANTGVFDAGTYSAPDPTRQPILYNFGYQVVSTIRFLRQFGWAGGESARAMGVPVCPHLEGDGGGNTQPPGTSIIGGAPWWNVSASSNRVFWYQFSVAPTTAPYILWPVRGLPPAGKIVAFFLRIKGAGGHVALPATMPTLSLYRQSYGGTVTQVGATVIDTGPLNTTQYQTEHDLGLTNLSESLSENTSYYFKFTGETGTNKVAGLSVYECQVTISS